MSEAILANTGSLNFEVLRYCSAFAQNKKAGDQNLVYMLLASGLKQVLPASTAIRLAIPSHSLYILGHIKN